MSHATGLYYRVFHGFGQAKFADGGSILGSSQFTQLSQLPLKTTLDIKKGQKGLKNNESLFRYLNPLHTLLSKKTRFRVSISPTFYEQLLYKSVLQTSPFLYLQFGFAIFLANEYR